MDDRALIHADVILPGNPDVAAATARRHIRTDCSISTSPSPWRCCVGGTIGTAAILIIPWALGGLSPTREDLTWSILIAFATAFLSVAATVLFVLDIVRFEAATKPAAESGAKAEQATPQHGAGPSNRRSAKKAETD